MHLIIISIQGVRKPERVQNIMVGQGTERGDDRKKIRKKCEKTIDNRDGVQSENQKSRIIVKKERKKCERIPRMTGKRSWFR